MNIKFFINIKYLFIIDYNGSMAHYEFINSFRESNNSTHPEIKSKTTMEKLKEIKDELGDGILKII